MADQSETEASRGAGDQIGCHDLQKCSQVRARKCLGDGVVVVTWDIYRVMDVEITRQCLLNSDPNMLTPKVISHLRRPMEGYHPW